MWVRLTYVKVDPTHADEVRDLYNSDEISGVIRQKRGIAFTTYLSPSMLRVRVSPLPLGTVRKTQRLTNRVEHTKS